MPNNESFWANKVVAYNERVTIGADCDIAPTAMFGANVRLGDRVRVAANAVLLDNVTIENDSFVNPNCIIGEPASAFYRNPEKHNFAPTSIGSNSIIRSGTTISEGVTIGSGFQTGSGVSIRENTSIGDNCSVGTASDVQSEVTIGDYCRLHSNVHLTQGAKLGRYVWIMPSVVFTNDNAFPVGIEFEPPLIGDYCAIGANCFFLPGVKLGMHVIVAGSSVVKGEHDAYSLIHGNPAAKVCDARKFFVSVGGKLVRPYPWPNNLENDYPWKDVPREARILEEYLK